MNDKSYTYWAAMSDQALAEHIGSFVRHHRLQQNKTQDDMAVQSGMSRSTWSLMEKGETITISTLIRALRVLDQLQVLNAFSVNTPVSPLALAKQEKEKRKRARGKKSEDQTKSDW